MSFRDSRQALVERSDLRGDDFCGALASLTDEWLSGLLHSATGGNTRGLGLVAVGGYGRKELFPGSDLDLVLVHEGRPDVDRVADAIWYPVWDEGVLLDHSVRTPKQVLEVAADDLRAQLGLLDGRLVAGDESVVAPLLGRALERWRSRAGRWLPALADQAGERYLSHGDVAFLLEPDLKEAHGGLRDVHAVRAAVRAAESISSHVDVASLEAPRRQLTSVRVELHRATGRATDRLLLQEQDQVAAALGYGDADALMGAVAEAGRTVAWLADDVWRRRSLWPPPARQGPRWLRRSTRQGSVGGPRALEPGIALSGEPRGADAEVVLGAAAEPAEDASLPLRVAAAAAERSLAIGRGALDVLAAQSPPPPVPWPDSLRAALVRVLGAGRSGIHALEALDQRGLLARLIPEWRAVRNRPQRNAYHRFTVDRHLLESAAEAAALASKVRRQDLLLVGALLHDIGKGSPGDHTDAGVTIVGELGRRMGFSDADADVLVSMVRNHLLLADTATRRDLDDPATVDAVVRAVGDVDRLELLAALTEADSLATGPAAWGPWKAGLVDDLVKRAEARMAGEELPSPASIVTERHRSFMTQAETLGRSVVVAEGPDVTVVSRDRPGLLAAVTGVFALRGLDVRSANVAGEGNFAVERFVVEPARQRWPDWKLVADQIDAALRGTLPLEERLRAQAHAYAGSQRASSPRPVATSVTIDNNASATSTVIEIRAADAYGLLHRITNALFELDLDVVAARVSTLGDAVVDAFYVREVGGGKVTDLRRLETIERGAAAAATPGLASV